MTPAPRNWLAQEAERDAEFCRQRRKYPPVTALNPSAVVATDAADIFGEDLPKPNQQTNTHGLNRLR